MTIDKTKAIELLERAVAEKGADYVDPKSINGYGYGFGPCSYRHGNGPGCIIGHALFYEGASVSKLRYLDVTEEVDSTTVSQLYSAGLLNEFEVTPEAVEVFRAAQAAQDLGRTWGDALAVARGA